MTVDKAFESTLLRGKPAAMMSAITVRGFEIIKQKKKKKKKRMKKGGSISK